MTLTANTTIRDLFEMANEFVRKKIIDSAHDEALFMNKLIDAMDSLEYECRGAEHD
ncbi:hypothetical protein ACX122_06925 [Kosakonia cowanii]